VRKQKAARAVSTEIDERVEKSKKAVLSATYELLTKSGLNGVSVDEVSRHSGVAKTTIYRHWPSRESLLLEACSQLSKRPEVPDTGSMNGDLLMLACGVAKRLQEPWATVLPSIMDAAERDKSLSALQSQIHAQMRSAFITVIERGQTRGELSASEDSKTLVASVMGPLLYRRFFSRESLDEGFAREVVERALRKNA
jgi:AcrR family transcriptional regulator